MSLLAVRRWVVLLATAPVLAAPPLDDARGRLRREFPSGLRWDNVERMPSWCGAAKPVREAGIHAVRLSEGDAFHLPMPEGGWLRLRAASGTAKGRVTVGVTDGSGLVAELPDRAAADGLDALYGPVADPSLLRVSCPRDGRGDVSVALFTLRFTGPVLPEYSRAIPLPVPGRRLGRVGSRQRELWSEIATDTPLAVEVTGPARLALELRLRAGREQARDGLRFRLDWTLDGAPLAPTTVRTAVDSSDAYLLDGRAERLGRLESAWVDVPPGTHRLVLESDRTLLARLFSESPADMLLRQPDLPDVHATDAGTGGDTGRLARIEDRARDLRFRDGGLAGLALLAAWSAERPDDVAFRRVGRRLAAKWTTFRTLLPRELPADEPLRPAYAWTTGLAEKETIPGRHAGSPAELEQALAALPMTTFHRISGRADYLLERRSAPSELRLFVEKNGTLPGGVLRVRYDDRAPFDVRFEAPPQIPPEWRAPGAADLGLALAALDRGFRPQPLLLGSDRAPLLPPLPLVDAGAVRIPLPADVSRVSVEDAGPTPQAFRIALQVRASRTSEPPPELPAALSSQEPATTRAFLESSTKRGAGAHPWLPLWRWLTSQAEAWGHRTVPESVAGRLLAGRPSPDAARHLEKARAEDAAGRRFAAVEAWVLAFRTATGDARSEALGSLAGALVRAGEPVLAESWLRSAFLHGDAGLREPARLGLESLYLAAGDSASRLGLLATAALVAPTRDRLVALAGELLTEGQPSQALRVLTLMPPEAAPELWVRAGRALRSETTLRAGLAAWKDEEGRALWEGILRLDLGLDPGEAWDRSGTTGAPWREARAKAIALAPDLERDPDGPGVRAAWAEWTRVHPGPWSWRSEPWLVSHAAGTVGLRALALDGVWPAFRALPGRAVRLRAVGPLRLRLEVHPLHRADEAGPVRGVLEVRGGESWRRRVPFAENWPSAGLAVEGRADERPGQPVRCELVLPAGLHELEVETGALPSLVSVEALRPEVPLGPLPRRSPETLRALRSPRRAPPLTAPARLREPGIFIASDGSYRRLAPDDLRSALLAPLPEGAPWEQGASPAGSRPAGESLAQLLEAGRPDPLDPRAVAARLDALASQTMAERLEVEAGPRLAALALAESLAAGCPEAALVTDGLDLLREHAGWTPFETASGAGVLGVPWRADRPWNPASAIRQALLGDEGSFLISASQAVVIQLVTDRGFSLDVELEPVDTSLLPPQPTRLLAGLDGEELRRILGPGGSPQSVSLPLSPGSHVFRVELESPLKGQAVRVRFPHGLGPARLEVPERRFEVARADAPLLLRVEGPRWLRVDRVHPDGVVEPEYRLLPAGRQTLTLAPPKGKPELLCAFSLQDLLSSRPVSPGRPWTLEVEAVPIRPEPVAPQKPLTLLDAYRLGGQEDGTSTFRLGASSRRDPDSDGRELQRSAEAAFEHRYLDPLTRRSWRWNAVARSVRRSGTSFGLGGRIELPASVRPLVYLAEAEVGAQTGAGEGNGSAFAGTLSLRAGARLPLALGRRTWHEPEVTAFWRGFAFSSLRPEAKDRIDLDLWSPFRDRNRGGVRLAESIRHRPWRDTLFSAEASLLVTAPSAEGLTLATSRLEAAWRQRLGPLEALVGGQVSRYGEGSLSSAPFTRTHLRLGLEGRFWSSRQNLLHALADVRWERESGTWTGALSLGWSFGTGRGVTDLRRGATAFPSLDELRLSRSANGSWEERPE